MYRVDKIRKFFEDKIDWKFFNFILDKTLMFEDDGFGVFICVCAGEEVVYKHTTNKEDNYVSATEPKTLIEYYKNKGISYSIDVFNMTSDRSFEWEYNSNKTVELYNKIKSRCEFIKFRFKNIQTILVKPK